MVIEPLTRSVGNAIKTLAASAEVIRPVDHPHVRLLTGGCPLPCGFTNLAAELSGLLIARCDVADDDRLDLAMPCTNTGDACP